MEHFFQSKSKPVAIAKMNQSQRHIWRHYSEQNKMSYLINRLFLPFHAVEAAVSFFFLSYTLNNSSRLCAWIDETCSIPGNLKWVLCKQSIPPAIMGGMQNKW